jgi:hypothetical protein
MVLLFLLERIADPLTRGPVREEKTTTAASANSYFIEQAT